MLELTRRGFLKAIGALAGVAIAPAALEAFAIAPAGAGAQLDAIAARGFMLEQLRLGAAWWTADDDAPLLVRAGQVLTIARRTDRTLGRGAELELLELRLGGLVVLQLPLDLPARWSPAAYGRRPELELEQLVTGPDVRQAVTEQLYVIGRQLELVDGELRPGPRIAYVMR